jgi:hypothetical protein
MTKRIVPVILLICLFLTACGGAKTLDVAAFGQKALTDLSFDDEMNPMPENLLAQLYGIDEASVKQKTIYVSTGYTPEEIVVIEAVDSAAAAKIAESLKTRVEDQRAAFENYIPEEMPKLTDPPIRTQGNYAVMIISGDDAAASALIDEFFKG